MAAVRVFARFDRIEVQLRPPSLLIPTYVYELDRTKPGFAEWRLSQELPPVFRPDPTRVERR